MDKRNPELEKAIEANPDDKAAWSVFADWLQAQGDPRGELIALQLAGKESQATALIESKADYFLGPLAEHTTTKDHAEEAAFTWKHGFIHHAKLSHDSYAKGDFKDLSSVLRMLLEHPSGRYLSSLAFGFNGDPNEESTQSLIDVLAEGKAPSTLRKVHFGDFLFAGGGAVDMAGDDTEISWYSVGDLSAVWPHLSRVETMIVQSGSSSSAMASGLTLGEIALPALKHFELRSGGMDVANTRAAMTMQAPNLEHLEIWFGSDNYGADTTIEDVEASLLGRTDLPKLRHLGLRNSEFGDAIPAVLAKSKLLAGLKSLDLSLGTMGDEGASDIAKHRDAFAHLERLDVSQCYLTSEGLAALKGIAKELVVGEQRNGDRRYAAVSE